MECDNVEGIQDPADSQRSVAFFVNTVMNCFQCVHSRNEISYFIKI